MVISLPPSSSLSSSPSPSIEPTIQKSATLINSGKYLPTPTSSASSSLMIQDDEISDNTINNDNDDGNSDANPYDVKRGRFNQSFSSSIAQITTSSSSIVETSIRAGAAVKEEVTMGCSGPVSVTKMMNIDSILC